MAGDLRTARLPVLSEATVVAPLDPGPLLARLRCDNITPGWEESIGDEAIWVDPRNARRAGSFLLALHQP